MNPSECLNNDSESSSIDKRKSEKKTKKRSRNPEKWAGNVSKRLKTEGKPYMGLKNKVKTLKHERITGPPCNCKYRCFNMITNKVKLQVLKIFNELGNKEKQDVFLGGGGQIHVKAVSTHRLKKEGGRAKTVSCSYVLKIGVVEKKFVRKPSVLGTE